MYLPSEEIDALAILPLVVNLVMRGGFVEFSSRANLLVRRARVINKAEPTRMHAAMNPVTRFRRSVVLRVRLREVNMPETGRRVGWSASLKELSSEQSSVTICVRVTFSNSSV